MIIQHPPSILADLAVMLLSNITAQTSTCATLLALKVPVISNPSANPPFYPPSSRSGTSPPPYPYPQGKETEVPALPLLVQAFVQGAKEPAASEERTRKGDLHFLSSVFANVSMVRTFLFPFSSIMLIQQVKRRLPPADHFS